MKSPQHQESTPMVESTIFRASTSSRSNSTASAISTTSRSAQYSSTRLLSNLLANTHLTTVSVTRRTPRARPTASSRKSPNVTSLRQWTTQHAYSDSQPDSTRKSPRTLTVGLSSRSTSLTTLSASTSLPRRTLASSRASSCTEGSTRMLTST